MAIESLHSLFLPKYNEKFTRKPKVEEVSYRSIPQGMELERIFSKGEELPFDLLPEEKNYVRIEIVGFSVTKKFRRF